MSWHDSLYGDQYHRATFRKIPFYIKESDTEIGRRNVLHQYPFRDTPYLEDMGAEAEIFTINAYVIQNKSNSFDYFKERNALIKALQQKGSGTLIHPFLGEKIVGVQGKAKVTETFDEGGIARFTITFVQAGKNNAPVNLIDYTNLIDNTVQQIEYRIRDTFGDYYLSTSYKRWGGSALSPSSHALSKNTQIDDLTSFCNNIKNKLSLVKGAVQSTVNEASTILDEKIGLITSVMDDACSLGAFLIDTVNQILILIGIPNPVIDAVIGRCSGTFRKKPIELPGNYVPMFPFGLSLVTNLIGLTSFRGALSSVEITNQSTAVLNANRLYIQNALNIQSISVASKVAARIDYKSYDDALTISTIITDAIDVLLLQLGEDASNEDYAEYGININVDDFFTSLETLRAVFIKAMENKGMNLARLIDYTVPPATVSSLVLAYEKYNDLNREQEIIDRNYYLIDHPGFLPQGDILKVLDE
jgi:prophage DNA circulation protein